MGLSKIIGVKSLRRTSEALCNCEAVLLLAKVITIIVRNIFFWHIPVVLSPEDSDILAWLSREPRGLTQKPWLPPVSHSGTEESRFVGVITHTAQQACTHVHIPTGSKMEIEMESKTPSLSACLSLSPVINLRDQSSLGKWDSLSLLHVTFWNTGLMSNSALSVNAFCCVFGY